VLSNLPIPIQSTDEQQQILQQIESFTSVIDQLEQTITTTLQQAEALRQSILKKAFSGQLVPQDPHDEPASVLLGRIHAAQNVSGQS
jgi:type I restriction enzyme S subunit